MNRHLTYIMALAITLLMAHDTDTNALYYIFGNDGSCAHGITHCKDPETPWSKQGTKSISWLCAFIFAM